MPPPSTGISTMKNSMIGAASASAAAGPADFGSKPAPTATAVATSITTMPSPNTTTSASSAAPNTALGLRPPRSTARVKQAMTALVSILRMFIGFLRACRAGAPGG